MFSFKTKPTSAEIDRRLQIVAELRNLCLSPGRARRIPAPVATATGETPQPHLALEDRSPGAGEESRKLP